MNKRRVKWPRLLLASLRTQLRHKLRAVLALLGIILGAGAVVLMVGLARGGRQTILEELQALGTNVLILSAATQRIEGGRAREPGRVTTLKLRDARALERELPEIAAWAALQQRQFPVKFGPLTKACPVVGITASYFGIRNLELFEGRLFDDAEVKGARRVAVLGWSVARELFGQDSPLGERLKVNGIHFEVIGVLQEQGQVLGAATEDDRVYVPLPTALRRLLNVDYLDSILVQITSRERMDRAAELATWILRDQHRIRPPREDDFTVLNQKELLDVELEASQRLLFLSSAVAAVSLLVGGVGILAVMTMTVRERTREIGLRRALGARRRDIFFQFLAESTLLSVVGGLLGVALGLVALELVSRVAGYPTAIYWPVVGFAFGFAALAGILFGLYPSSRASRLEPLIALRYE